MLSKAKDTRGLLLSFILSALLVFSVVQTYSGAVEGWENSCYRLDCNAGEILEVSCSIKAETVVSPTEDIENTVFFFQAIPINLADAQLLQTVVGVGPKLAQAIIEQRNTKGPFTTTESINQLPGVGDNKARYLATQFCFDQ